MRCRCCGNEKINLVLDLGMQPLSNDYISDDDIDKSQNFIPLKVGICNKCWLMQVIDCEMPDKIFNDDYKYFSSFSTTWLKHCEEYVDMIVKKLNLSSKSSVLEIASNDGYLLQYFKKYKIIPLGIEPSKSTAEVAMSRGINTIVEFWGGDFAQKLNMKFDLILGNNVLAHVPDIRDFVIGIKYALADQGTITIEFPHLLPLISNCYFDTIYHEHYSYLSLTAVWNVFDKCGLKIYDVEEISTHGGSLRIYSTHKENIQIGVNDSVRSLLNREHMIGIDNIETYNDFREKAINIKYNVLERLISYKRKGLSIVGYGAAAKGNTFFNYIGIGKEFIDYVVDASPYKQGLSLPGTQIPIYSPEIIKETKPDIIVIIPWNIKQEIYELLSYTTEWGAKLITLMPNIEELS